MFNPVATYRIQFNKEFTFSNFERIIPYLAKLGVSTIYASPIFEAVPGSSHGYDVVNPHRINPEIGTLEQFRKISQNLRRLGISWLQDIVPNHMAFHQQNTWLMDVLENGRQSAYAKFFDILWEAENFGGKLMIPVLGDTPVQVIQEKQLSVVLNAGGFSLSYGGQCYPLNVPSYRVVLEAGGKKLPGKLKTVAAELSQQQPHLGEARSLLFKAAGRKHSRSFIEQALATINSDSERLQTLLDQQYYVLSDWKESNSRINYRRFFTVNSLICLNMQDEAVFNEYHSFIRALLDEGLIQGLRVDHIDGLFDPTQYLERLRRLAGEHVYIVVEKILEEGESFPANWPVQGNTGYDFLAQVNNLLTDNENKEVFTSFYQSLTGQKTELPDAILKKKAAILRDSMGGELNNLLQLFIELRPDGGENISVRLREHLKAAIAQFLIRCPVYRYYGNHFPLPGGEKKLVRDILNVIVANNGSLNKAVALLKEVYFFKGNDEVLRQRCLWFYQRCMQFAGPLMAKGVEDTLMYTYDRFIGHNEVGDSPEAFGFETGTFHRQMLKRQALFPLSLNATSTHDTKRGEDVRARLNVLTDLGDGWIKTVRKWLKLNESEKDGGIPDRNDEYLIYQTLVGCYPLPALGAGDLGERLKAYLVKALREAKVHSQWPEPDENYENGTLSFAEKLLAGNTPFHKSFISVQREIADLAVINSLTQVLLKYTCPGVPDVYQGCESWDLSLVDPDNRRPVDFESRSRALSANTPHAALWQDRYSGGIKIWLTSLLYKLRGGSPDLFSKGAYIPLRIKGKYKKNLIAFARKYLNDWLIVVAPLHLAALEVKIEMLDWENTKVVLPESAPLQWVELVGGQTLLISDQLPVKDIFRDVPVGLFRSCKTEGGRGAGVIMHITSLPSLFGTGDMGPEARKFADFLVEAGQKYWQLLPLNPTSASAAFSPYSSFSSMAGNMLLISPEELVRDGWLTAADTDKQRFIPGNVCDFKRALRGKRKLFGRAFKNFQRSADDNELAAYRKFKESEAYWLDDFALYEALKAAYKGKAWYDWPSPYKFRQARAIEDFCGKFKELIEKSKWLEYVFLNQWTKLKTYTNGSGLKTIGDLPFYISYDSADVWTNPGLFKLGKGLKMAAVAGVPPDYFNDSGQLWGMPVYNWQAHVRDGYQWWTRRLSKNLQFFDLVRLDHFRAFYDFWEVPATEKTAINGSWQEGPRAALFRAFDPLIKDLPFIAEDLGDISAGVYRLRDELKLPGMNVLQYAFGPDMPITVHAPHNHKNHSFTYTGTHDNNTAVGWFRLDASKDVRLNLENYARAKVNETNIHEVMLELCYRSAANIAMAPMQDILGLDERHRMNTPSAGKNNWQWRLEDGQVKTAHGLFLAKLAKKYNR
jgi:malto-oligosyltrehalose synthase/4-alpha-glucanotransferase